MAAAANVDYRSFKKLLLPGGMGVMAVDAASLVHQWPVHPVLVKGLLNHIFVTIPA